MRIRRVGGWLMMAIGLLMIGFGVAATFIAIWSHGDSTFRWGNTALFAGIFGVVVFVIGTGLLSD